MQRDDRLAPEGASRFRLGGTGSIHATAEVSGEAEVAPSASVWHRAQVREGAVVSARSVIGMGAYVGPGVIIGRDCKVQNYALIYQPAILEDGVFVGPAAVLTNDRLPRAITPVGHLKGETDWRRVGVRIREGASVGARAVCVAPVTVGRWAMVAAGAVVVHDVPDFALVAGTPARHVAWVGRTGERLEHDPADPEYLVCMKTGDRFQQIAGQLVQQAADSPRSPSPGTDFRTS